MSAETFRHLAGSVRMEDGRLRILRRGDEIPAGMAKGEMERLRELGAIGSDDPAAPAGPSPEELAVADAGTLATWITDAKPKVSDVLELAGEDAALAERLLAAEKAATGGDPRVTLVEGLEAIIAKGAGE